MQIKLKNMSKFGEANIQEQIVKRFNELVFYKQIPLPSILFSNRNENKGIISGKRYKEQGRKAGVPDLTLLYDGKIAFIELKTPKAHKTSKGIETKSRGLEPSQVSFFENYIRPMKIPFTVCSSVVDFETFLRELNLLK
tara:strand:- start:177 stop:593 length:417 start_codon:yes stop_codon:yes gene_type:complete